jgi:hypothetical protein
VNELTRTQTDSLCYLIDMIEYPGISNTEVGNNFERFSNWVSLIEGSAAADVPYEFCIVYSHDEYKCDMRRREGKVES